MNHIRPLLLQYSSNSASRRETVDPAKKGPNFAENKRGDFRAAAGEPNQLMAVPLQEPADPLDDGFLTTESAVFVVNNTDLHFENKLSHQIGRNRPFHNGSNVRSISDANPRRTPLHDSMAAQAPSAKRSIGHCAIILRDASPIDHR